MSPMNTICKEKHGVYIHCGFDRNSAWGGELFCWDFQNCAFYCWGWANKTAEMKTRRIGYKWLWQAIFFGKRQQIYHTYHAINPLSTKDALVHNLIIIVHRPNTCPFSFDSCGGFWLHSSLFCSFFAFWYLLHVLYSHPGCAKTLSAKCSQGIELQVSLILLALLVLNGFFGTMFFFRKGIRRTLCDAPQKSVLNNERIRDCVEVTDALSTARGEMLSTSLFCCEDMICPMGIAYHFFYWQKDFCFWVPIVSLMGLTTTPKGCLQVFGSMSRRFQCGIIHAFLVCLQSFHFVIFCSCVLLTSLKKL